MRAGDGSSLHRASITATPLLPPALMRLDGREARHPGPPEVINLRFELMYGALAGLHLCPHRGHFRPQGRKGGAVLPALSR